MLAEDMNLVIRGEVQYDCLKLDNIERAVRYINQRGLPRAATLAAGPFAYTCILDPKITRYNNYMTLTIVPNVDNQAAVTLDIDGLGVKALLRNDGQPLKSQDMRIGKPLIIAFFNDAWYVCGMVASQVPILSPALDFWIRTDGNDTLGDGTANTPEKAFRTIRGCWAAVGSRYAATPSFAINMRLGIPGTYEGASVGPFGGSMTLTGDANNPAAYRLASALMYAGAYAAMWVQTVGSMLISGVTFLLDRAPPDACSCLVVLGANVGCNNCRWEVLAANPTGGGLLGVQDGGRWSTYGNTNNYFIGNNLQIHSAVTCVLSGHIVASYRYPHEACHFYWQNINVSAGLPFFWASSLSTQHWGSASSFNITNCVGAKYGVTENSIMTLGGLTNPGSTPGAVSTGGIYIP